MGKIKLGIIGLGRMGITHYSIINSHPDVEICAIADPSIMITQLLKKYFVHLKVYKNYDTLLEKEKLDAVLICTPPNLHYPIIKAAALHNMHVFVEKPFTADIEQANELNELYIKNGLINQIGYVNRFNNIFKKVIEIVQQEVIGDIIRFKSEMFSNTITTPAKSTGWRASHKTGGGVIFEMASHAIDLINYIIGEPNRIVGSSSNQIFSQNVEDVVSSTFLYKNGIIGTMYVNWSDVSYRKPTNQIEIFGTKGKIQANQFILKIFLNNENKKQNLRLGWNTLYITDLFEPVPFYVRGNEFTNQLYHFINCIQQKEITNLCSFKDGISTHKTIESILYDLKRTDQLL